jgi:hypothetical protein
LEPEKNVKNKMTGRITNDKVFQRAKEESLLLKIYKNKRHSLIWHTIRLNKFVVNILQENIRKKGHGKTSTTTLKERDQKHRSCRLYSNNSKWKAANQSKD